MGARLIWTCACILRLLQAGDQNSIGAGNARAAEIASASPRVQTARQFLASQADLITDAKLRAATKEAVASPGVCVLHRANLTPERKLEIVRQLRAQGLLEKSDDAIGVFPPLLDDGGSCPRLPQPFYAAPGGAFGGHHSYPGGLVLHERFNEISSLSFANAYRRVYGPDLVISQDVVIAAPLWHDWAKTFVFQWNADGTEFHELNFGGGGATKTGAHHILGLAEAIKRGLPADFVISLACAHAAPVQGQEDKVASWIRTAAILAQVDPVALGYLRRDDKGFHLSVVRQLGPYSNLLAEYLIHNLSDSDFSFTGTAMIDVESMLVAIAPEFGFTASETARYNNDFRNVVLSRCTAERLLIIYGNKGLDGVKKEIRRVYSKRNGRSLKLVPRQNDFA